MSILYSNRERGIKPMSRYRRSRGSSRRSRSRTPIAGLSRGRPTRYQTRGSRILRQRSIEKATARREADKRRSSRGVTTNAAKSASIKRRLARRGMENYQKKVRSGGRPTRKEYDRFLTNKETATGKPVRAQMAARRSASLARAKSRREDTLKRHAAGRAKTRAYQMKATRTRNTLRNYKRARNWANAVNRGLNRVF